MSWFTDLAGKAEQLLNKVDQTAAVALKKDEMDDVITPVGLGYFESQSQSSFAIPNSEGQSTIMPLAATLQAPASVVRGAQHISPQLSPTVRMQTNNSNERTKPVIKVKPKKQMEDEQLFEFLNSENTASAVRPTKPNPIPTDSVAVSNSPMMERISPITGPSPSAPVKTLETPEPAEVLQPPSEAKTKSGDAQEGALQDGLRHIDDNTSENPVVSSAVGQPLTLAPQPQSRLSSLEFENRMLKTEIESQKKELVQALQRCKVAEAEMQQHKKRLEQSMTQLLAEEKIIRDFQERDADLRQTIDAKDSQLAVLRVRLQEADQELGAKRDIVEKLQTENRRILEDHTSSSGLHNQAILTVQERLQQSEDVLERERVNFRNAQSENFRKISQLEEELRIVAANFSELQTKLTDEKSRNSELSSQLKMCRHNVESSQQELTDYKIKAQRILQSKEKLIATLKENTVGNTATGNEPDAATVSAVELEELRQERDLLKEELLQTNHQATGLRAEMQELEMQLQQDVDTAREQYRDIEDSLREERERKKDLEQEMINLKEELKYLREDYTRQKTTLQSRIQDRDAEIEKLRKQLMAKQLNSTSQDELESRLNSLTESLIQKQTVVEALSSEKSSLVFQLERMEKQLKEQSSVGRRTTSLAVNVTDDNDKLMVESPFDGKVARKVKRVYNTIDTLSIRLGVFMRRYPIARILIIAYMVMLHLWVMIVLLTYTPEIHGKENCTSNGP